MVGILKRLMLLTLLTSLGGCASSYNCYPCGMVNCSYCPANPLPYSLEEPCNCNDSIGQEYLAEQLAKTPREADYYVGSAQDPVQETRRSSRRIR